MNGMISSWILNEYFSGFIRGGLILNKNNNFISLQYALKLYRVINPKNKEIPLHRRIRLSIQNKNMLFRKVTKNIAITNFSTHI